MVRLHVPSPTCRLVKLTLDPVEIRLSVRLAEEMSPVHIFAPFEQVRLDILSEIRLFCEEQVDHPSQDGRPFACIQ